MARENRAYLTWATSAILALYPTTQPVVIHMHDLNAIISNIAKRKAEDVSLGVFRRVLNALEEQLEGYAVFLKRVLTLNDCVLYINGEVTKETLMDWFIKYDVPFNRVGRSVFIERTVFEDFLVDKLEESRSSTTKNKARRGKSV